MKRIFAVCLVALLAIASQVSADVLHADTPGLTLYVRVRTADTTSVAVALTEGTGNGVGFYTVTDAALVSGGLNSAGTYSYKVFQGAPSTSANDPLRGIGQLPWSGSVELPTPANATYWAATATASTNAALFSAAQVESEANDALVAKGLDHLLSAAVVGADITDNSIIAKLASKSATADWDSFANTTDSLEALSDTVALPNAVFDNTELSPARVIRMGNRNDGTSVGEKPLRMRIGEQYKVWLDMSAVAGQNVWLDDAETPVSSSAELTVSSTVGVNRELVVLDLDAANAVAGSTYTVTVDVIPRADQIIKAKFQVQIPSD